MGWYFEVTVKLRWNVSVVAYVIASNTLVVLGLRVHMLRVMWKVKPIPTDFRQDAVYTPVTVPIFHRAKTDEQPFTHIFTPMGNLEWAFDHLHLICMYCMYVENQNKINVQ